MTIFIFAKCERSENWRRLRDWSFCPSVSVSIVTSHGGDMHSCERLLVVTFYSTIALEAYCLSLAFGTPLSHSRQRFNIHVYIYYQL